MRDDHPIGIRSPTGFGPGTDFNQPGVTIAGNMAFFDNNGSGTVDTNEVRLYDSGSSVECASCNDPHGVSSSGSGSRFNPSFLPINNGIAEVGSPGTRGITSAGPSALCLTCHIK